MATLQTTNITGSLNVSSSGLPTGSTLLSVDGFAGRVFSVIDSLSGSLFSVAGNSGVPIIEVFSDQRVNIGQFNGEAIKVQVSGSDVALGSGSVLFVSSSKNVGINTVAFDATAREALLVSSSTYNIISADADLNNYAQTHVQNFNAGTAASSDVVTTNNAGTENGNYVDMGINSSGYTAGFIGGANDGYIYNTGSQFFVGNASPGRGLFLFAGGVTNTASVFLSSSGNVGIGTTLVTNNRLNVLGNISCSALTGSISGSITTALTASSLTVANNYLVSNLSASVGLSSSLLRAFTISSSNVGIVTGLTVGGATTINGATVINNTLSASSTITLGTTNVRGALSASLLTSSGLLINGNISASGLITASSLFGTGQLIYQEFHATGSLIADAVFSSSATTGSDIIVNVRGNTLTGSAIGIAIDVSGSTESFAISASRGTIAGTTFRGNIFTGSNFIGSINTISSSATVALDLNFALTQMQLSQSITTLNHTNSGSGMLTWMLATVGAGTAVTIAWPTSYKWPGGVAPSLTTTAGKRDVYQFMSYDGASTSTGYVFATVVAQNM